MAAEYLERMGARIREAREAKGLSQAGLARLLPGTTDGNQISRWELGKHRPGDDTLEAIAVALDVDVSRFLAAAAEKTAGTPDPFVQDAADPIGERLDRIEKAIRDNRLMLRNAIVQASEDRHAIKELLNRLVSALLAPAQAESGEFSVPTVPQELRDALTPEPEAPPRDADTRQTRRSQHRAS